MNEAQYNIVKIMQAMGAPVVRFAHLCGVSERRMRLAYSSGTFQQYADAMADPGRATDDMMDQMGL